jgi:hypothetical protein
LDTTGELPSIKFSIFHVGGFSISEVPLGEVVVSLHDVDASGGPTEMSYPLKKSGRMTTVSGQVCALLSLSLVVCVQLLIA